jgi:hypothetical protein
VSETCCSDQSTIIDDATPIDRSGSVVLELLLRGHDSIVPGFHSLGSKETITVGCWYLWWMRRWHTHNESVPPIYRCRMSVLSIATNAAKSMTKPSGENVQWSRPEPRQIKVNVDGSFHADSNAGAASAVLRDYEG